MFYNNVHYDGKRPIHMCCQSPLVVIPLHSDKKEKVIEQFKESYSQLKAFLEASEKCNDALQS